MEEKEYFIGISIPPEDPVEKKDWVEKMTRIQIAMYIDDQATCEHCGYTYKSVDDFMRCNPRRGFTQNISFVCSGCWKEYEKLHSQKTGDLSK